MSISGDHDQIFKDDFDDDFLVATAAYADKLELQQSQSSQDTSIELLDSDDQHSPGGFKTNESTSSMPRLSQDNSPTTTEYKLSPVDASFIEEEDSYVMVEKEDVPEYVSDEIGNSESAVSTNADVVPEKEDDDMNDTKKQDASDDVKVTEEYTLTVTSNDAIKITEEESTVIEKMVRVKQKEQMPEEEEEETPQPEATLSKVVTSQLEENSENTPEPEQEKTPQSEEEDIIEQQAAEEEKEEEEEEAAAAVEQQQTENNKEDNVSQKQEDATEEISMEEVFTEEAITQSEEEDAIEMMKDTSSFDDDNKENITPPEIIAEEENTEILELLDTVLSEQEEDEEEDASIKNDVADKEEDAKEAEQNTEEDDDNEEEEEYEVEAIRTHKTYKGAVKKYVIKWKGWPEEDNTLETSESIHADVPEICTQYWSKTTHKVIPSNVTQFIHTKKRKASPEPSNPPKKKRAATFNVSRNEVTRRLKLEGFIIPSTEEWPNTIDEWEKELKMIRSVQPSELDAAKLLAYLEWNNGKKTIHLLQDTHYKCPKKLIDYYEGRLRFF
ncbi:hypothetical protein K501DRAFT_283798, partial [Backusella circina FSU 941]